MRTKQILSVLFLFLFVGSYAQKINKQELEFDYIQLPLMPLNESIKNYKSHVNLAYVELIEMEEQKAEDEYQEAMEKYPTAVKYAEDRYEEAMAQYEKEKAAYDEKSTASKIVEKQLLNENSKPVKPAPFYPPPPPRKRTIEHQKVFNQDMLASTYLKLDGFNNAENGLNVTATLFGFENSEPEAKQSESSSYNTSTKKTTKVYTYWWEVTYKHPINIKIEGPQGEVILDETFAEFNEFKVASTAKKKGSRPAFNRQSFLAGLEEKVVEENMDFINNYINDNYGFPRLTRNSTIYRITSKKHDYSDYQKAFEAAAIAYNNIISDYESAAPKLKEAIEIWEQALTESDPGNKKARINNDATLYTLFNLAEAYIWTSDFTKAEEKLNKVFALKYSKKEKRLMESYKDFLKEHKERWQANYN